MQSHLHPFVTYILEVMDAIAERKKSANQNICLGYEAAVCGGIPIIHTLQRDYIGDSIQQIAGIMNGTTNFMLSAMEADGMIISCYTLLFPPSLICCQHILGVSYEAILAEAQAKGYAEADPTGDVEGHDARHKLCLLTKLAFGVYVPVSQIPCKGISRVISDDFEYAKLLGGTVKLLGLAKMMGSDRLSVCVSPCIVPSSNRIAGTTGAGNCVEVV